MHAVEEEKTQAMADAEAQADDSSLTLQERLELIIATKGVNTKSSETGATLLHYAAINEEIDTLNFLIKQKGIDLNPITSKWQYSPLHAAAHKCADKAATLLLKQKDTDATPLNSNGQTAYELAVAQGCTNPEAFK